MNKLGVWCFSILFSIAVTGLIILVPTNNFPVELTVTEVSLIRSLGPVARGNVTASVAHSLSFAVTVYNPNTVTRVWRAAPLDAELRRRGGGRPFAHVRLAGGAEPERIGQMRSKVYRAAVTVPESVAMALGRDADAVAVSASRLELIVHGEFKYVPRICSASINTTVRCPLRLPLSMARSRLELGRELPELCTTEQLI